MVDETEPVASGGPLRGIRAIEFTGLGPAPFAAMMLADMGAEVVRIERAGVVRSGTGAHAPWNILHRGRHALGVELKHAQASEAVLRLVERADVLIEGFRPSVMERLGLGPEPCLARNPRLVYGRVTGYGQSGPLAHAAGHDINYIALAGALEPIGRAGEKPVLPLNLLGDFGGGGMLLVCGVLAALVERAQSGKGQVVDAAMVDGAALLCTMLHAFRQSGVWSGGRGENLLDGGAPFYDVYQTGDALYLAIGALEPEFYRELLLRLGLEDDERFRAQLNRASWPAMREALSDLFRTRTRAEWEALLAGTDACFAPVLSPAEAPHHPHNRARGTFTTFAGNVVPAPAPRFSRTASAFCEHDAEIDHVLHDWGLEQAEIDALRSADVIV